MFVLWSFECSDFILNFLENLSGIHAYLQNVLREEIGSLICKSDIQFHLLFFAKDLLDDLLSEEFLLRVRGSMAVLVQGKGKFFDEVDDL